MLVELPDLDPAVAPADLPAMIPPSRSALVIIDVQEDFLSPDGAAGHWGIDLGRFEAPLAKIEKLIAAARSAGAAPVFVRVVSRAETDSAALKALHRRKGYPEDAVAICRAGTKGADYYRIRPEPGEIEIEKILFSGFAGTDLEARLRARGIETLVVAGFTTECCVDSTVRDAFHRNFNVFLVADACAAYEDHLHIGALHALSKNCAMLTDSEAVLSAWR